MANKDIKKSFLVQDRDRFITREFPVAASYAGKSGDDVYLDSAGRATATEGSILGIQDGLIKDVSEGGKTVVSTASADDLIDIFCDPLVIFGGQIASGALADKYTTRSGGAAFDGAGSAGARYINQASSTYDVFKVIRPWVEFDTGEESAIGAYQKVLACFNLLKHTWGTTA